MSTVTIENDGAICTITLNAVERRNAVDGPMARELARAFERFERDDALRVAVLCGAGDSFCAGADLSAVNDPDRRNELDVYGGGNGPMGVSRMVLKKPLIAAVEGHAVAGGLELALWCDLRVAARDAVFGVYCRRFGVPLVDGGTLRLPRLIGMSYALDLILTGRGVSGEEALRMGLANRIVEPGHALQAARALAQDLARFPQLCLRGDRRSAYEQWSLDLPAALANETRIGQQVVDSGETRAGAVRFARGAGRHGRTD